MRVTTGAGTLEAGLTNARSELPLGRGSDLANQRAWHSFGPREMNSTASRGPLRSCRPPLMYSSAPVTEL